MQANNINRTRLKSIIATTAKVVGVLCIIASITALRMLGNITVSSIVAPSFAAFSAVGFTALSLLIVALILATTYAIMNRVDKRQTRIFPTAEIETIMMNKPGVTSNKVTLAAPAAPTQLTATEPTPDHPLLEEQQAPTPKK